MKRHSRKVLVLTILSLSAQASDGEPLFGVGHSKPSSRSRLFPRFVANNNSNSNYNRHNNCVHQEYSLSSNYLQPKLFRRERRRWVRFFARLCDGIGTQSLFSRIGSMFKPKSTQNGRRHYRFLANSSGNSRTDGKIPLSFTPKDGSLSLPSQPLLHGVLRKWPRWLRFPRVTRDEITKFSTIVQYTALVVVLLELFFVVRDVIDEFAGDFQGFGQDSWGKASNGGGFRNNRYALSKKSVQKIIAWFEKMEAVAAEGGDICPPPPNVATAWILTVAQELHNCNALSLAEVQRILLELTNAEFSLLDSCLLSSHNKVDVNDGIGGLFAAKSATHQLLLSSLSALRDSNNSNPSIPNNLSPYTEFLAKGGGHNDMVLWGPPGSGKSLLIRAIAKSSGLPTLLLTPSMMQRNKSLEGLFSLIETLGSCVVVLDDLDGLFLASQGNSRDYYDAATRNFRNEWLQRWDDLLVSSADADGNASKCVLTIAATSRPWDVDTAAWRRLPNRIYVGLPNAEDRYDMLKKWSKDLPPIEESVLQYIVAVTEGYIPSDIYQVLHNACQMGPIARQDSELKMEDANAALSSVMPTRFSAQYIQQLQCFVGGNGSTMGHTSTAQQQQSPSFGSSDHDFFSSQAIQALPYCENGYCWETPLGNFYQFQIPTDSQVLAAIQTILSHSFEWGSSEEWDFSDYDDDEDDDDEDEFDERDIE